MDVHRQMAAASSHRPCDHAGTESGRSPNPLKKQGFSTLLHFVFNCNTRGCQDPWNCDEVAYGIKPQGDAYTCLRVMPYTFGDSIQCASALIPCQACGLDKKITSEPKGSDVIFFGDPWENRTPVTAVKGRCLSRLTNGPGSGDWT